MIISCNQCNKKFEIESSLIPDEGRLLQCSSCNFKWFYKKNLKQKTDVKKEKSKSSHKKIIKKDKINYDESYNYKQEKIKKISFINIILVFIISIIALIALVDTFKNPISLIFPDIKFILNSLYETLTDIVLFFKDLL